jgi:hypothetical protein
MKLTHFLYEALNDQETPRRITAFLDELAYMHAKSNWINPIVASKLPNRLLEVKSLRLSSWRPFFLLTSSHPFFRRILCP